MYVIKIVTAILLIYGIYYYAVPLYNIIITNSGLGIFIPIYTFYANDRLFTEKELSKYSGEDTEIYLAVLGKVFDVSKGADYYGPGKTYHKFAGRDGSRAFITGDFSEQGLNDDVLTLSSKELMALMDWLKLYQEKYIYKGKLIGRYYDSNGMPTSYNKAVGDRFSQAKLDDESEHFTREQYPPCNVEYKPDIGSTVWCSRRSGGIIRNWIGSPRKLYLPGAKSYRCACVNIDDSKNEDIGLLEEYKNCDSTSTICIIND